jgi:hypothetical protein
MGNCCGKSADTKRAENWKATGIVSLRDAGLKAIPGSVLDISNDVRILDATNNRYGWPHCPPEHACMKSVVGRLNQSVLPWL